MKYAMVLYQTKRRSQEKLSHVSLAIKMFYDFPSIGNSDYFHGTSFILIEKVHFAFNEVHLQRVLEQIIFRGIEKQPLR